ncbi:MAG: arginase [Clostridia bacterium]|nr:arginase [Clostridia bacterium]
MEKCLLSVDWDYFISCKKENLISYIENDRTAVDLWYKRYFQDKARGINIQEYYRLTVDVDKFWSKIKKVFRFPEDVKVYVSDSHSLSYFLAQDNGCDTVFLFDAHADLGYGGPQSLDFEVNCANWLGKLLQNKFIKEAYIIYSPFTSEKPENFVFMNNNYNIRYLGLEDLKTGTEISVVHICRSGAWTPPWLDQKFFKFVNGLGFPYKLIKCPPRKWDTKHITFSDQLNYFLA